MKTKNKFSKTWQNGFQGTNKNPQPTKIDPPMSDEEVAKSLNIPQRDKEKYPMPTQQDITTASALIYKINLMGAQLDQNLGALLGQLYIDIYNHINAETQEPNNIINTLDNLRNYIRSCNNPIFDVKLVPGESNNDDDISEDNINH